MYLISPLISPNSRQLPFYTINPSLPSCEQTHKRFRGIFCNCTERQSFGHERGRADCGAQYFHSVLVPDGPKDVPVQFGQRVTGTLFPWHTYPPEKVHFDMSVVLIGRRRSQPGSSRSSRA